MRPLPSEIAAAAKKGQDPELVVCLVRAAVALILLAIGVSALNRPIDKASGISFVWLSNGWLTGVLLCAPKRRWPALVVLGCFIDLNVNHVLGSEWLPSFIFAAFNMVEVVLASSLAYAAISPDPDLTRPRQVRHFLAYCVFLAPTVTACLSVTYLHLAFGAPFFSSFRWWFAADVLGMATVVPLYLSFHHGKQFSPRKPLEQFLLFALLTVVTVFCFRVTHLPTLWAVLFVLMLLGVRLGFTASAAGLLLVTFIGGYFTFEGFGPLGVSPGAPQVKMILLLQCFIALSMLVLYGTEVALAGTRRSQAELRASEARFRSLAETSRDIIVLTDLTGKRQYVSPAVIEVLGMPPEMLLGRPFNDLVHPDDLPQVEHFFADLAAALPTAPLAFRSLSADSSYRWVETTARPLMHHATGQPEGFVCVLRDIADRKDAEERLLASLAAVEKLALVDGLTGVANRREFDRTLEREWQRAIREQIPISLLLIDVDRFKVFNDLYGHLAGDECLRFIARFAESSFHRSTDLLARYGGEEFVGVLPNTLSADACALAESIRTRVAEHRMPHRGTESGFVTISVGIGTICPKLGDKSSSLIEAADGALYRAKQSGRNRTELAAVAYATLL